MLELLYQALREEHGVCLIVSDCEKVRAALYRIRSEAADPDLAELSFVPSPTASNELWILRRKPNGPA